MWKTPFAAAIEATQPAMRFEFGLMPGVWLNYIRGQIFLKGKSGKEAAAEFQKILDHPGITLTDPIGPIARLQLARALSASGDRARSAAAYKELLMLWKDADPEIPVVREARAESTR